jgi:shikimate dehydrogenase
VQATPIGQKNNPGNILDDFKWNDSDFAADLVYNPLETVFLTDAISGGAKTMNGLGMLIEQAALSQTFWLTGEVKDVSPLVEDEYRSIRTYCEALLR